MKIQLIESMKKSSIKKQLYSIYIAAVIVPITLIGSFLLWNTNRLLTNYYRDLLESDNSRVKNILFEITTQVYNISEELAFDTDIRDILTENYYMEQNLMQRVDRLTSIDNYNYNYAEIEDIEIYTDNSSFRNYKQFRYADYEIQQERWYQKALNQSSAFWVPMMSTDKYGNEYWNLSLVRKITLLDSDWHGVLVIKVCDNYLNTRISSQEYETMISVDEEPIFFSSDRDAYGTEQIVPINYGESFYRHEGNMKIDDQVYFVDVSTLPMYQSDSNVYICTMNGHAYGSIISIIRTCLIIIAVAVLIPGILVLFFMNYFTSRVLTLRHAMHQASNDDYEITDSLNGRDELSEAFSDLKIMVRKIKDKDAQMYEAQLKEKELVNEQQEMEFKVLASQINPHFLYNTLETIRMKAFKAGDREVATAIKLLGKSLRYVLENTGTAYTTLNRELEHVETYLAIQKLRFGDKFDSVLETGEGVDTEQIYILPLLLQPVVENALLHGLEEKEKGGEIRMQLYIREEFLFIDITDNGCGMEEKVLEQLRRNIEVRDISRSKSIGLYNINQRLKLSYGGSRGMRIYSEYGKGTTVRITLPLEKVKNIQ